MTRLAPVLDHVVIDVRERLDEGLRVFRALGFQMTDRGYHTIGSANHLAMLGTDYVELLGWEGGGTPRLDIAAFPPGLNGLVFKTENADAAHSVMQTAGFDATPVRQFSRPVQVDGGTQDATFRTTFMPPGSVSFGRMYFCEHLTPELVWRPEWQAHPNGAVAVAGVVIAAQDPRAAAGPLTRLFEHEAFETEPDGRVVLSAGEVVVEFVAPAAVEFPPDPAGRTDMMAQIIFRSCSIAQTTQSLEAGGIDFLRPEGGRIVVPPAEAMNVTLVFME